MAKLYFLGGEDLIKRDCRKINAAAFLDAGEDPSVVVFSWARACFHRAYRRRSDLSEYFRSLGAGVVNFVDYSDSFREITEKIEGSDLIYLPGGLASVLVERLKKRSVDRLLHKYDGVVVGRSAGALALGKKCVVTKHKRKAWSEMIKGIGLVNFCLKAHYRPSKDESLKRLSKEEMIYAIPERSALVYDDGALSFIGNVYLFQNAEKTWLG